MEVIWCPICGGDFEEKEGKVVCTICSYVALPADLSVSIEPQEAKEMLAEGKVQLIDVRTVYERMAGQIPDSVLIPINEIRERTAELDKSKTIITYCQHGIRSFHAAQFLKQHGFNAKSLRGGIEEFNNR